MIIFFAMDSVIDVSQNCFCLSGKDIYVVVDSAKFELKTLDKSDLQDVWQTIMEAFKNNERYLDLRKKVGLCYCEIVANPPSSCSSKIIVYNSVFVSKYSGQLPFLKSKEVINEIFDKVEKNQTVTESEIVKIIEDNN